MLLRSSTKQKPPYGLYYFGWYCAVHISIFPQLVKLLPQTISKQSSSGFLGSDNTVFFGEWLLVHSLNIYKHDKFEKPYDSQTAWEWYRT